MLMSQTSNKLAKPNFWDTMLSIDPWVDTMFLNTDHSSPKFIVHESDTGAELVAEVPGMSADNLEITVANNTLTVKGNRAEGPGVTSFTKTYEIKDTLDPDTVSANLANGILTISIEKHKKVLPRRIEIKS